MLPLNIDLLAKELKQKHHCHTIILYGSYADNTHNENSDIDIICIKKDGEHYKDARLWNDIFLDVWIYPEDKLQNLDEFIHIALNMLTSEKKLKNDELVVVLAGDFNGGSGFSFIEVGSVDYLKDRVSIKN